MNLALSHALFEDCSGEVAASPSQHPDYLNAFERPHPSRKRGWDISMRKSKPNSGTNVVPADSRKLAESFSPHITHLPIKVVAEHANRTSEAVKKWRAADVTPDTASVINMARGIPEVKAWLFREIDPDLPEGLYTTRTLTMLFSFLGHLASGEDGTATKARALLNAMHGAAA